MSCEGFLLRGAFLVIFCQPSGKEIVVYSVAIFFLRDDVVLQQSLDGTLDGTGGRQV